MSDNTVKVVENVTFLAAMAGFGYWVYKLFDRRCVRVTHF